MWENILLHYAQELQMGVAGMGLKRRLVLGIVRVSISINRDFFFLREHQLCDFGLEHENDNIYMRHIPCTHVNPVLPFKQ